MIADRNESFYISNIEATIRFYKYEKENLHKFDLPQQGSVNLLEVAVDRCSTGHMFLKYRQIQMRTLPSMFCEYFQNIFFTEHLRTTPFGRMISEKSK